MYGKYKNPHYGLRVPVALMDKLKYIAAYNGRSANKEIELLIRRRVESWEKQHGEIVFDGEFTPRSRSKSE